MKGPSIHQGTAAHKSALKIKSVEARKAEIGAAGASAEGGSKSSPVKKDWATAIKNDPNLNEYVKTRKGLEKGSKDWGDNQYKINKAYYGEETAKRLQDKYNTKYNISTKPVDKKIEKIEDKAEKKVDKITAKSEKKIGEVQENVDVKKAKRERKTVRKTHGRGSKEHLEAKLKVKKSKEADRTGKKGGKRQGLFRKLSSKMNKKRQEKLQKRIDSMEDDSPVKYNKQRKVKQAPKQKPHQGEVKSPAKNMKTGKYKHSFESSPAKIAPIAAMAGKALAGAVASKAVDKATK